jgi:RNA polymerase sigma factor (sigma-70 family)
MDDFRLPADLSGQIGAFLAGDHAAGEVLARRASRLALKTAGAVLRDREDAGDVAQEVVVEALRSVKGLRDPEAFDAWVHKITVRVASRVIAKRERRDLDYVLSARLGLVAALARLPVRQRLAVTLRYVHDLSDAEIAGALGCRIGTVHALLSRARTGLRSDPSLGFFMPVMQDTIA